MKIFLDTFAKFLGFFSAILVFIIIINFLLYFSNKSKTNFSYLQGDKDSENLIAIINIQGPIMSESLNFHNFDIFNSFDVIYPSIIEKYLEELVRKNVKALIITMTSPGGSVSASEQIYKIISNFKKIHSIPVYFHTNELLTSGAYWVSLSGDKIYANYGSIIGSIGVKGPDWLYYNDPTLISNGILGSSVESPKGIQMFSNFAGNSKDIFNPFRQPNEKEKLELQKMVDEIYEDFLTIVASSRKIEKKFLKEEIGAMFFNSKRAKQYFLIDDQKEINEIIDIISNKLKLKNKKIIINTNNETYNLFNIPKLMNRNYIDKNMLYKRVCDNFTNGFSSISTINYSINC